MDDLSEDNSDHERKGCAGLLQGLLKEPLVSYSMPMDVMQMSQIR